MAAALRTFDTAEVKPEEIDGLGHMNVRFYMERAQRANRLLLADLGVGADEGEAPGVRATQVDTYVRYQREQFQGQLLSVNGGVLEATPTGLRAFYELANPARGEIAATFIIATALTDRATGGPAPLPPETLKAAEAARIELPDYGRPRTIDLTPPRLDLTYDAVAARISDEGADPWSRRMKWPVPAEACDEHGNLVDTGTLMFGGFRPPSAEEMRKHGPMTFTGDDGHRLGWASLETRMVRVSQARAGDILSSISAEVGLHAKVRHSRRWLFNLTSGQLVSLNDNVSIALDLDARRAIDIPPSIRRQIEASYAPEFA
jgi:acyl-CoA thioester hydrolase